MKSAHSSLWIINKFGYNFRFHAKYDDATVKVTTRNVVFMKQCHESSDDYLFPITANKILSEKAAILMLLLKPVVGSESLGTQKRFTATVFCVCSELAR